MTTPAGGTQVTGTVPITAIAADAVGVTSVTFQPVCSWRWRLKTGRRLWQLPIDGEPSDVLVASDGRTGVVTRAPVDLP
jgi:hypothetical protein